jgi:hypothetical protein
MAAVDYARLREDLASQTRHQHSKKAAFTGDQFSWIGWCVRKQQVLIANTTALAPRPNSS